ncbi:MAG: hydroxymethylbilane synthase [Peptococcaceae bacterium BRH_c4b]|nr:MAG: hydroxymethylbilane synthase [Peptococcaceae bacterium BRH_c4b]
MRQEIVVGSRDSRLAMWQAEWVVENLRRLYPGRVFRVVGMKTKGDNILDAALAKLGDKGLFTKELEMAMLRGEIDMAVHSMKDLPTELPRGLIIGAVCRREHPGDVLISKRGLNLDELPAGAVIGTSSLRRTAQLLNYRPDFRMAVMRGNLLTRLRKLEETDIDATVLAYAGIHRLNLGDRITQLIPFDVSLPAVGQGSIGIEIKEDDREIAEIAAAIDHPFSRAAITAERGLMRRLEGGCQVPIGALGLVDGDELLLEGVVASLDGKLLIRRSLTGPLGDPAGLGVRLAEDMLKQGAGEILRMVRREFDVNE